MKSDLIIVFTCPDRPGVVEHLTSVVVKHGGNWEESRLARLCGDFAGIARVSAADANVEQLSQELKSLAWPGLTLHVKSAETQAHVPCAMAKLQCAGADHEGIVSRITAFLAKQKINVEELSTAVVPAPTTGTPVFQMSCLVGLPESIEYAEMVESLRELGRELAVDLTLDGQAL
ncbi:MAG: hypothetical protein KDB22_03300 [Planctomycetales bacterium]|nr:hypothetical protein [Planctomycetales bacterium]